MLTDNFLLAVNDTLTIEFSGYEDLIHKTDESDNPQDLAPIYLGALDVGVKLQATSDLGVDDVTITPVDILPEWVASTAVTVGQCLQPTTANGYRYRVSVAGTTGSTEPVSWPLTVGSSVISGTATFVNISPKHDITEVTLALDPSDLDTNIPGGELALGNTILGGIANAIAIYIRVENQVNIVSNNTAFPEIGLQINGLTELEV